MTETKGEASNIAGIKSDPRQEYQSRKKTGTLRSDVLQEQAVEKLQRLYHLLYDYEARPAIAGWRAWFRLGEKHHKSPQGLYIFGPVGRGKSMLTDLFFDCAPVKHKRRVHFHEFMIKTHNSLHELRSKNYSKDDLISSYAKMIQLEADVIFFDEFQVTNIADAMILSQLFTEFFNRKIKIVLTTNIFPDDLYKDGLQRVLFLPFIELIKKKSKIFELDTGKDYRKLNLNNDEVYFSPINLATSHKINDLYIKLSENSKEINKIINVKGREVVIKRLAKRVSRFYFDEICGLPLGAEDYLSMISFFDTIIIENIKNFSDAFFEATSGLTTTGATILEITDENQVINNEQYSEGYFDAPKSLLLWRSQTQWLGGMGIIVLATIIFSRLFGGGIQVLQAEMPGTGITRLKPQMAQTARLLWTLYFFLTLIEIVLLYFAGLPLYDSICNSFSTVSTGGFSPKVESIGSYDSAYVDIIVTFFMLISGVNFVILYYIFNHIKDNSKSIQSRIRLSLIHI